MSCAGRHDQIIVTRASPRPGLRVWPPDRCSAASASSTSTFCLVPQNAANRRGDVARAQAGRRDLVEQRLKKVMISPVDERELHGRLGQRLRGGQPTEPPPTITTRACDPAIIASARGRTCSSNLEASAGLQRPSATTANEVALARVLWLNPPRLEASNLPPTPGQVLRWWRPRRRPAILAAVAPGRRCSLV